MCLLPVGRNDAPHLAIIGITIIFSSFLSGVFGMAGGMVVLGVLLVYLDVGAAMILFSIIQFFANGWRALQWRQYVPLADLLAVIALGGAIASAACGLIEFVPDKAMVYLLLGFMPFAVEILPPDGRPNIEWRGVPFVTGCLRRSCSSWPASAGVFLDIFFQKSMLDRKTTSRPRRWCRSPSHVLRAVYFVRLAGYGVPPGPASRDRLAIGGTTLAPYVIERMTDHGFRQWTRSSSSPSASSIWCARATLSGTRDRPCRSPASPPSVLAVFVASFVSGVFGMAGGMIMLGVLLIFFDVPTAMVMFSLLQLAGNVWRVAQWWRYINLAASSTSMPLVGCWRRWRCG